jgi:hypothetical protein
MMNKTTFNEWLSEFFMEKNNELDYSLTSSPKRMEKITLDLSVTLINPFHVKVPFKSMIVSRIYSTASGLDKGGTLAVLFDQANLGNIKNAVNLFPNDTLRSGTSISQCFLTWQPQADTSCDIYFYPDIEVVAGTTKTQIVGTVTVANTNATAAYVKNAIPSAKAYIAVTTITTTNYTVPPGKFARVTFTGMLAASGSVYFYLDSNVVLQLTTGTTQNISAAMPSIFATAGQVIGIQSLAASCNGYAYIEIYDL